MRKIIPFLILFVFIGACSNSGKSKKPKNLLTKDQMVNILLDVSFINSAKGINKSILKNNGVVPEEYIYKKHQIDSLQFVSSNQYYSYNLKEYQEIIDKVNDSLKTLQDTYDVLVRKDSDSERKADSIKKSKQPKKELLIGKSVE